MKSFHEQLDSLSLNAIGVVQEYFNTAVETGDDKPVLNPDNAQMALKLIGHKVKHDGVRAKQAEVAVNVAKMIGLSGSALNPIFESMTGTKVPALPHSSERPDAETQAV